MRLRSALPSVSFESGLFQPFLARHRYCLAGEEILTTKSGLGSVKIIIEGWAARTRGLVDGRRQILSLLLPGDVIAESGRPDGWSRTTVSALTTLKTTEVGSRVSFPTDKSEFTTALQQACAMIRASEETLILDQVVRLGVQNAGERMGHLLLELRDRLYSIGLCRDGVSYEFPLTQLQVGEVLGLSQVHVNRTLQRLRTDKLVALRSGRLTILEPARLKALSYH